jgi:aminoethylphosphonate catabolism LysR family transcriptional regulator
MNYAYLRAFHQIVEQGGVTQAAATLGLTQPTLSGQVKALQALYGVRLIERSGRGVQPTELGQALHAMTRRFFAVEAEMAEMLEQVRDPGRGRLRLGADAPAHVIPALALFNRRHPGIRLSVTLGNSRSILDALLDRRCDVAVIADPPRDRRLHAARVRIDRLVALVPASHAWAGSREVAFAQLARQKLVLREPGSRTRAVLEAALAAAGVKPEDALEMGSREGVLESVAAGLGVGVIFDSEYRADSRLRALGIKGAAVESAEYLACLAQRRQTPSVDAFFRLALALADDKRSRRAGPAPD